jgi:hypothetical protein
MASSPLAMPPRISEPLSTWAQEEEAALRGFVTGQVDLVGQERSGEQNGSGMASGATWNSDRREDIQRLTRHMRGRRQRSLQSCRTGSLVGTRGRAELRRAALASSHQRRARIV